MEELSTEYNSLRDLHLFTCIKYRVVFSFITIKYVHHLNVHQSLSMIQQGTQVGSYFYLSLLLYLLCIRICCLLNDVAMNSDYCKRLV